MTEPGILNIKEAAARLPGFKVGGQWRFRRPEIEAWIDARTQYSTHGEDRER